MNPLKVVLLTLLLTFSITSKASFLTGNHLHEFLNSPESTLQSMGFGFVAGIHDASVPLQKCVPRGSTLLQISHVVRDILNNHPEIRHMPAADIVFSALVITFKCPQPKPYKGV